MAWEITKRLRSWVEEMLDRRTDAEKLIEKQEFLMRQRTELDDQHRQVFSDVEKLEERDATLKADALAATKVQRPRLASLIARVRNSIEDQHVFAGLLTRQIRIVDANLRNLRLLAQNQKVPVPNLDQMTAWSVEAESALEDAKDSADFASSLQQNMAPPALDEDEARILAEIEAEIEGSNPQPEQAEQAPPQPAVMQPGHGDGREAELAENG